MQQRLVAFDLDDTLWTSKKVVSSHTAEALWKCKKSGMVIGYITARAYPYFKDKYITDRLPCDFIAYFNGAAIYSGKTLIARHLIPYPQADKIIQDIMSNCNIKYISIHLESWSYKNGEIWNVHTGEKLKSNILDIPHENVQRIRLAFGPGAPIALNQYMTQDAACFRVEDGSALIVHKNATKENALKQASEWFGIPMENTVAFGDDVTDMEMLRLAGIGVAMGNAIDAVKKAADDITETNDNEGISSWINRNLLSVQTP